MLIPDGFPTGMTANPPDKPRPGYPASPCNSICTLDESNFCVGCRRSLEEIVAWSTLTAEQQWAIVRALETR